MSTPIIADTTLTGATNTIDVTIANLDTIEIYLSVYFNGSNSDYYLYLNEDYTNANYFRQRFYTLNGATFAADTNSSPHLGVAKLGFTARLTIMCNGLARPKILVELASAYTTDYLGTFNPTIEYIGSDLASISAVRLESGVANGFGIGTRYIVRDPTV